MKTIQVTESSIVPQYIEEVKSPADPNVIIARNYYTDAVLVISATAPSHAARKLAACGLL